MKKIIKKIFLFIAKELKRSYMIAVILTVCLYVIFSHFNLIPDMVEKFWRKYNFFFSNTITIIVSMIGIYFYLFLYNIRRIRIGWKRSDLMRSEELYPYLSVAFFHGILILVSVIVMPYEITYVYIFLVVNILMIFVHRKVYRFVSRQLFNNNADIGTLQGKRALLCGSLIAGFPVLLLNTTAGITVSCMIYLFTWAFYYGPSVAAPPKKPT